MALPNLNSLKSDEAGRMDDDLPEAVEETPTEPEAIAPAAEERSELEALGDIVQERAMPSLDETISPAASPAADAPASEAAAALGEGAAAPETAPSPEDEAIRKFAEENGLAHDEAREMLSRQARVDTARRAGATQQEAEHAADNARNIEQMMRQNMGGGGGAVGALVGGIAAAVKGVANLASAGVGKMRSRPTDFSPDAIRERTFEHYYDIYERGLNDYRTAGDDIKKGVDEFNAAFLNTEGASKLRKMAKDAGQDMDSFMADLNEGRNSNPEAVAAAEAAFSDRKVKASADRLGEAEERAKAAQGDIGRMMDKIGRNFPERIDASVEAERIDDAGHDFDKGMKNPLYESKKKAAQGEVENLEQERKRFMERMKELSERIRKLVDKILSKLGLAPKP